jgi:hypothetical protein
LITHARTGAARFLGYEITVHHNDRKITRGRRVVNGSIGLRVPKTVIKAKSTPYLTRGKPERRSPLVNCDDYTIINTFGMEYRGLVQYYLMAGDVWRLSRLRWVMVTSMLKTLACKYNSSVSKMAAKYQTTVQTPHGPRKCFQASVERTGRKPITAQFDGIPLQQNKFAILSDRKPVPTTTRRIELIERLLNGRCEICKHNGMVETHQVRKLADLTKPGRPQPEWAALMVKRRRKTLVVCEACHKTIHTGQPAAILTQ